MSEAETSSRTKSARMRGRKDRTGSTVVRSFVFSNFNKPLVRSGFALWTAVLFAALAYYGFSASKPIGSPFFDPTGSSWLPPLLSRDHEPAYADHDYLPVGPKDQFFHRERLKKWEALEQPIKNLVKTPGVSPWRIRTEEEKDIFDVIVDRLYLSSDRKHLGAIGVEGEVYFYQDEGWKQTDTRSRGDVRSIVLESQFPYRQTGATGASFSPDGSRFLTFSDLRPTQVWDVQSGNRLLALQDKTSGENHAVYSPDNTRILTASKDGTATLWDAGTGAELLVLKGHADQVLHATFDAGGQRIATASQDNTARIWDAVTGNEIAVLKGHTDTVTTVQFSPDGERLLTSSDDTTARIWDSSKGVEITRLGPEILRIYQPKFSRNGEYVLAISYDNSVRVWNANSGQTITVLSHEAPVSHAEFSSDGSQVLTTSAHGRTVIWNTWSELLIRALPSIRGGGFAAAFSPDGRFIALGNTGDFLGIWDASDGRRIAVVEGLEWNEETQQLQQGTQTAGMYLTTLAFSGNGSKILGFSNNGSVFVFDVVYDNDQSIQPTALDAAARLLFGKDRLQWIENGRRINVTTFFPVAINASTELGGTGIRIAVGDGGAIYLGIPDYAEFRPPGSSTDVFNSLASSGPVGVASNIAWLEVRAAQSDTPSLFAVHFDGMTGIAVGEKGAVLVSHDGGLSWTAGAIGEDHLPTLTDIRIDTARNYAVAIGRPAFDGAPSHGVLYKTKSLPDIGSDSIGDWKYVPWEAGAPVFSYFSIVISLSALLAGFYYLRKWWVTRGLKDRPVAAGKSDREIGWDDEDVLGLHQLSSQVSLFLRNARTEPPLVLGVAGGWGSGKSSFMNLLCQDLKQRGTSAVWFNAWHHQNEDHLLAALFEAVRTRAIPSVWTWRGLWFRARLIAPRLWAQFLSVFPVALLIALAVVLVAFAVTEDQVQWLGQKFEAFEKTLSNKDGLTLKGMAAAAVPVVGLLYWLRSLWIALPAKPAKLLKNFSSLARIADFQDKLSFRYNFGKAFGEVCSALRMPGVPGLVIFIDDLDRCQASSVLSIFEAVNYFVSVGDCIVVMGFDRAQVEHSIGEELKHIADGIPDKEIPFHFEKGDTTKRRAYARHYMEKLINLEIAIPPMTPEAAAALVEGRPVKALKPSADDERWLTKLKPRIALSYKFTSISLRCACIAALLWAFWTFGGRLYERIAEQQTLQIEEPLPLTVVPVETGRETTVSVPQTGDEPPPTSISPLQQATGPETDIRENPELDGAEPPPEPIEPVWRYEELWILVPVVLLLALVALWIYLQRAYSIAQNVTYDPDSFTDALKDANQVIEGINGTPRAIKRYMNRMRFASARMRQINYSIDFLDLLARWLGWVSMDFERNAESPPQIDDAKVIALGTAEAFLQGLPEPDKIDSDPQVLIDTFLQRQQAEPSVKAVASKVKRLLDEAEVDMEHARIYASMLHSSYPAALQENVTQSSTSNDPADLSGGFSDQAAE
ncbi:P-loop NTPase fold protein [Roseibium sp. M-1]